MAFAIFVTSVTQLDSARSERSEVPSGPPLSPAVAVDTSDRDQCVIEICGSQDNVAAIWARGPLLNTVPTNVLEYVHEKIDPLIQKYVETDLAIDDLNRNSLPELLTISDQKPMADVFRAVVNSGLVFGITADRQSEFVDGITVRADRFNELFAQVPTTQREWLLKFWQSFMSSPSVHEILQTQFWNFDLFMQALPVPDTEPLARRRALADLWRGGVAKMDAVASPLWLHPPSLDLLLKKMISSEELSEYEKRFLVTYYQRGNASYAILMDDPHKVDCGHKAGVVEPEEVTMAG